MRSSSPAASSRRSRRSRSRSRSSLPVRRSRPSRAARASSSARSATSSASSSPPSTSERRSRRWSSESKWSAASSTSSFASSGCAMQAASASRSRRSPARHEPRRGGGLGPHGLALRRDQPRERLRGRSRRSTTSAERVVPFRRAVFVDQELPHGLERLPRVARPVEDQPRPVEEVALRAGEPVLEPRGASAGSCPGGSVTTRTSKPCAVASSMPRSVASCPAASASKQR